MKRIRSLHKVVLLSFVGSCASLLSSDRASARDANVLHTLTGFSSKESCSCAFVVEQTDEYCQAFGKMGDYDVNVKIDRDAKTVTSSYLVSSRTSRFTEGQGCLLDPLPLLP
ncbi:MAG TPA: hypothetical protein VM925_03730 [Labilithrix sp.]|jgi:hypothetical protein|nr:hypothetical protein [Labilithrix sp.]